MTHTHNESRQPSDLAILEHLMARGEMVASQLPAASHWTPEKRLAAAIFAGALVEIRDHAGERKYRRRVMQDLEWVRSHEAEWPISFLRLCELFGLEAAWVRSVVQTWIDEPSAHSRRTFSSFRQAA
jgi:hypothetical protein